MNKLVVNVDLGRAKISKHIYGQFAEQPSSAIYPGIWVGPDSPIPNTRGLRNDVIEVLRKIKVPNVRWPGGASAEEYHWRDGLGPREKRPRTEKDEDAKPYKQHDVGTHEFMDFCELVGCEPYLCCNLVSGSVEEAQSWIEYLTSAGDTPMARLRRANGREEPWSAQLWAVGNEAWAYCDRPEPYAKTYLEYAQALHSCGDVDLYRVACGPGGIRYDWTDVLMREAADQMEGLAFHHYSLAGPWKDKGPALGFTEDRWALTMRNTIGIEMMIRGHSEIMDRYDPEKKVALVMDEWGTWHGDGQLTSDGTPYQQNAIRDAVVAAMMLNMFNNHCERVRMANLALMVNGLQAVCLTQEDQTIVTPTGHVFEMFTVHHEATMLPVVMTADRYQEEDYFVQSINASASRDDQNRIHLSLCNLDPNKDKDVECELRGAGVGAVRGRLLTGEKMDSHNTFDQPNVVEPADFTGARIENGGLSVKLPAKSIVVLELTPE